MYILTYNYEIHLRASDMGISLSDRPREEPEANSDAISLADRTEEHEANGDAISLSDRTEEPEANGDAISLSERTEEPEANGDDTPARKSKQIC